MRKLKEFFRFYIFTKSITTTILFSLFLVNFVLLLILGLITLQDSTGTLTKEIINYTSKVMDQAKNNLDFNFEDVKTPFALLTANSSIIACLNAYPAMSWEERLRHDRQIEEITTNINTFKPLISDILIIGKNGYLNNLDNRRTLKWNYDFWGQKWFRKAIAPDFQGKKLIYLGLHLQDYYLDTMFKYRKPTFSIAMPIFGNNNNILGAAVCNFDIDKLNNMMMLSNYERSGRILLLDNTGTIIAHKDKRYIGKSFLVPERGRLLKRNSGHFIATIQGKPSLLIFHTSKITNWKIVSYIPLSEILDHSGKLKKDILRILLLCILLNGIICILITLNISQPVKRLIGAVDNVRQNNLNLPRADYKYSELNYLGAKFAELVERVNILNQENYETQVNLKQAELNALQTQINPHFLFNTLQLLQTDILYGKFEESNRIILALSSMLRYSIYEANAIVPIKTEIAYVKNYLHIYSRKFRDKLQVSYAISPELEACKIPKLLLQPILENSIKHGFGESPENGRIEIAIRNHALGILIAIADNGTGIAPGKLAAITASLHHFPRHERKEQSHIGLCNIQQRIKLRYGESYGLSITSQAGAGTVVDLLIPALSGGGNDEDLNCG